MIDRQWRTPIAKANLKRCGLRRALPTPAVALDFEEYVFAPQARARRKLEKKRTRNSKGSTDAYYTDWLSLRSAPLQAFVAGDLSKCWELPITSVNESKLLRLLGIPSVECSQIEGLRIGRASEGPSNGVTVERQASRTIARLAANPPHEVGRMQRLTSGWLLRP